MSKQQHFWPVAATCCVLHAVCRVGQLPGVAKCNMYNKDVYSDEYLCWSIWLKSSAQMTPLPLTNRT